MQHLLLRCNWYWIKAFSLQCNGGLDTHFFVYANWAMAGNTDKRRLSKLGPKRDLHSTTHFQAVRCRQFGMRRLFVYLISHDECANKGNRGVGRRRLSTRQIRQRLLPSVVVWGRPPAPIGATDLSVNSHSDWIGSIRIGASNSALFGSHLVQLDRFHRRHCSQ